MNADQIASLAYLGLLLAAIGGWFFVTNRDTLSKTLQMAALWGLIFLGVIAAYGLWDDIRRTTVPLQTVAVDGQIQLPRAPDGHFYAVLDLNGTPVNFLVDTGATQVVLMADDAARVGIDVDSLPFLGRAQTANGPVQIAYTTVDQIRFGPSTDTNVGVSVTKSDMGISLLGMSYLGRFETIQIGQDQMILVR